MVHMRLGCSHRRRRPTSPRHPTTPLCRRPCRPRGSRSTSPTIPCMPRSSAPIARHPHRRPTVSIARVMPPAPLDRYGSPTLCDCTACGLQLRGVAEQVRFTVQFQRSSTCAMPPGMAPDDDRAVRLCEPTEQCEPAPRGNAAAVEEGGVAAESRPLWRRRWTGCGVRADGTTRRGRGWRRARAADP
jgi:hypothetical protein